MKIEKVALLGAGAVGAYFIWGLSEKMGENFCVVAKGERKKRLEKEGLTINGKHFTLLVKEPEEVGEVDLLLVSSKQDALFDALEDIKTMVSENTIVISLLNGVTSEEIIGNAIGMEHMLYSVMRIASVRKGNEVVFAPEETAGMFVGEKDHSVPTDRLLAVEKLFRDTGIRYNFVEKIELEMWIKYAANIAQNLPQAIISVGFGAYTDSEHVHFIAERLWKEVSLVANAKGIPLQEEFMLFQGPKPEARFSTLQDLDAGRHTEIEMFAGEMMRMGKECGISVPYCEYTYHLIKALEEKNDGKFQYRKEQNLSEEEVTRMVQEADQRFEQGTYEETFEWMKEKIKSYPNCKRLLWQFAAILDAQRSVKEVQDAEKYDSYILDCYERVLDGEEEELRTYAADSLFGYYVRKEEYEKAEEYLKYYSEQNPERKRKQAMIFSKTGRSDEAYKAYEEILFSGYQMLNLVLNSIYMLAMQEENCKKAHQMVDKHQELARVFEMGTYHEISGKLELAVMEQDTDTVVETVEKMLDSVTEMMSFTESELYEHMTFQKVDPEFIENVKKNLIECFQDEEIYEFLKEDERWKKLI